MSSIREVAKFCGVSTATVSHVLRGRTDKVGDQTRQKVLAAVRKLQYKPAALETQRSRTRNLGVLVPDITHDPLNTNTYLAGVLNGILQASALASYSVTIFIERMWDDIGHSIRSSYDGRCDGLLYIAPSQGSEVVTSLQERGTPIVLIGSIPWLPNVSCIDVDNPAISAQAAQHLAQLGHKRVAYLCYEFEASSSSERNIGFLTAAASLGLEDMGPKIYPNVKISDPQRTRPVPSAFADVLAGMSTNERPTAVFCWNDGFAVELMRSLLEAGIDVPGEISIVAVDDSATADKAPVPLTTFRQPLLTIGSDAANLLIERIEHPERPDKIVRLSAEFIIRDSAVPPGREGAHPSHDSSDANHSEPMEVPSF